MPEFQDRILTCTECGAEFVFTAGEQHFYHDKNFKNEPKRCKACKSKRQGGGGAGPAAHSKVETLTVCSQCGRQTTVPFKPTQGRPVYCRECFLQRKGAAATAG
ncbi:MAG: zinc-ribbon domain containing protein [Bryobacteraceae bacterium]